VAFEAAVSGTAPKAASYSTILVVSGSLGTATPIASTLSAAPDALGNPGQIGNFSTFGDPVFNSNSEVAFFGALKSSATVRVSSKTNQGLWGNSSGKLCLIASEGQTDQSTGAQFASFSQLMLPDSGGPLFVASLVPGTSLLTKRNNQSVWGTGSTGGLELLIGPGQPLAGGTLASFLGFASPTAVAGQTRSFDSVGDLIFTATLTSGTQGVYIRTADGAFSPVAETGQGTPETVGNAQVFAGFSSPIINNRGNAAFHAMVSGSGVNTANNAGIWAETGTGTAALLGKVARTGDPAPGNSGAVWVSLGDPVTNNNDDIAFSGTVQTASGRTKISNQGLWLQTGSTGILTQLAQTQQPAPDCGGAVFASFSELALSDAGNVIVLANLAGTGVASANNQALCVIAANGQAALIARKGDALGSETVSSLSIFSSSAGTGGQTRSFNSLGDLVYKASFTDGTQGIYEVALWP
jgi:hypothetical protein